MTYLAAMLHATVTPLDKAEKERDVLRAALETAVSNCFTEYSHRQVMEDPSHFVNAAIKSVKGGE